MQPKKVEIGPRGPRSQALFPRTDRKRSKSQRGGSVRTGYLFFRRSLANIPELVKPLNCRGTGVSSKRFPDIQECSLGNILKRGFVMSRFQKKLSLSLAEPEPKPAISCWYSARHESAAMWSLYARNTDAIAIRTTFKRFRDVVPEQANVGLVKYVDYTKS